MEGTLEGYNEIMKILETLGDQKLINNLLKAANRESVKPLQKQIKGLPYGRLSKKVSILAGKIEGNKHPNAVVVGPTSQVFQIRFVDKGTVERYTKAGAYRGKIEGKKLAEALIENGAKDVQKTAETKYAEAISNAVEKYTKRIAKKK
jgi:hypothetical protein